VAICQEEMENTQIYLCDLYYILGIVYCPLLIFSSSYNMENTS